MKQLTIELPWPPAELSPNARVHYFALSRAKKRYRRACWLSTLEQKVRLPAVVPARFHVWLEFSPPDRDAWRSYDRDNLIARMKAGLDGICDALQIDDDRFESPRADLVAATAEGGVRVRITGAGETP